MAGEVLDGGVFVGGFEDVVEFVEEVREGGVAVDVGHEGDEALVRGDHGLEVGPCCVAVGSVRGWGDVGVLCDVAGCEGLGKFRSLLVVGIY